MFDDVLSATALIGVGSVLAVAVFTVDTPRATTAPPVVAAARPAPPGPATTPNPAPAGAMPIYELPRVVVTGHRTRDGDVLADGSTPTARDPAPPPR